MSFIHQDALVGRHLSLETVMCHFLHLRIIIIADIMVRYDDELKNSNKQTMVCASPCTVTLSFMFMYTFSNFD